jgi:CRP-like cAMP-binding protein
MNPLIQKMQRLFPLTADEEEVLKNASLDTYQVAARQDIIHDGEHPSRCHVLLSGTACRYKTLANGKSQILSFQFPGDIFDAQSFLLGVMDHSISAMARCTLGVIPHTTMSEIIEEHPRLVQAIWKDPIVDAAVFREWITNVGQRQAYGRIAHLMCEVYVRSKAVGVAASGTVDWPMTQSDLGDATGLSPVHVNRTLQRLRADGLISLGGKTLHILDFDGLQRAGDFDPAYLQLAPSPAPKAPAEAMVLHAEIAA